ncbi:MAG: tyrosine-type recombinase/integrase, partial [Nitrospiraceae bacterium]
LQRQMRHATHVFTQSDGRAYRLEQVGMAIRRTAKRAQLPGVSLHVLRHTLISRLVQAGRSLPEVAALAGYRDITMTFRYAHLAPSHLRAGIQALEDRQVGQPAVVIHRNPCHAGVTGFLADGVSAGAPKGTCQRGLYPSPNFPDHHYRAPSIG